MNSAPTHRRRPRAEHALGARRTPPVGRVGHEARGAGRAGAVEVAGAGGWAGGVAGAGGWLGAGAE